jgi:hypothetical protein
MLFGMLYWSAMDERSSWYMSVEDWFGDIHCRSAVTSVHCAQLPVLAQHQAAACV